MGPVELLVLRFPHAGTGDVGPALRDLMDAGTVRIVDVLFVNKAADGALTTSEVVELDDATLQAFDPLRGEGSGLLSAQDAEWLADHLEPGASAGLLLIEHTWATAFRDAVAAVGGELLMSDRIPRATVDDLLARAREGRPGRPSPSATPPPR